MKNLLAIFLCLLFMPCSLICNEDPNESSIIFPPGTPDNIKELFFKLGNNAPDGLFACSPGFARVPYTQEMIDIAKSAKETTPVLLVNMNHPKIGNPSIEILGDLRVKEAIPPLINILISRTQDYASAPKISLAWNVLAKITQHPEGYYFYRRAFLPEIVDQAITEYTTWYKQNRNKQETEVLSGKKYDEDFYLPRIPFKPERNWNEIPEKEVLTEMIKQFYEAEINGDYKNIYRLTSPYIKSNYTYDQFVKEYSSGLKYVITEAKISSITPIRRWDSNCSKYYWTEVKMDIKTSPKNRDQSLDNQEFSNQTIISDIWVYVNDQWYFEWRNYSENLKKAHNKPLKQTGRANATIKHC